MNQFAVQCDGVSKTFGNITAVNNISLAIKEGHMFSLVGPSGCGKTTALRLIAGFEEPNAGTITIRGITACGPQTFVPPERRKVGMVFQDYALFPHLTIKQNVRYGLNRATARGWSQMGSHAMGPRTPNQQIDNRVHEVLEIVGLSNSASRLPHHLSGGEQQRVALARALAPNPAIVLLDEPFSNLDPGLRSRVRGEVRQILKESGTSAIFVTHDQDEAFSLADSVGVMLDGKVRQVGAPEEIYTNPNSLDVASFLGDANLIDGTAANGTVTTELGNLILNNIIRGSVKAIVRPEMVRVSLPTNNEERFEVVARDFYGHDQVIYMRLSSGMLLRARCTTEQTIALGAEVTFSITSPVTAFAN